MVSKKNLKDIKKRLLKGYYTNLEQVKNEVLDVIDYFQKENEITQEEQEEYQKTIECFFSDAKQIIEEQQPGYTRVNLNSNKLSNDHNIMKFKLPIGNED